MRWWWWWWWWLFPHLRCTFCSSLKSFSDSLTRCTVYFGWSSNSSIPLPVVLYPPQTMSCNGLNFQEKCVSVCSFSNQDAKKHWSSALSTVLKFALKRICFAETSLYMCKRVLISIFSLLHGLFCNQWTSRSASQCFQMEFFSFFADFQKLTFFLSVTLP